MSTTSQPSQVLLPELGESVTEGTIVEWKVAEGDTVEAGDILLELTTDKVDVEVPAPMAGVIVRLVAAEGDTVEVGSLLAEISPDGAGAGTAPAAPAEPSPAAKETPGGAAPEEVTPAEAAPAEAAAPVADAGAGAPAGGGGGDGDPTLVPIVLPEMESVVEGTVVDWYKQPGDRVEQNEDLLEISTDKVDTPVPSPVAGVLHSIAVGAGDSFEITQALGYIAVGDGAAAPAAPAGAPASERSAAPAETGTGDRPAEATGGPPATPLARRLAGVRGVDLGSVEGTGPAGMIRRDDVARAGNGASGGRGNGAAPPAAPAAAPAAGAEEVLLKGPAAVLAGYMDASLTVPTATSFRTLGVGTLDAMRRQINADLAAAGRGEKLSFTHLIAWAIVRAATTWRTMNTGFERRDGKPYALRPGAVNLGLAVDVERKDGSRSLMVPVVKNADTLGFRGFRDAYDDLVKRTRSGGLSPDDLRGASITLTNPGGIGTVASVPRLMAGQGTIVATGSIAYPPGMGRVAPDTLRQLGVEKVMTMTSTYDHRVIQGAESGGFLADIDRLLQGEDGFYDEVRESLGLAAAAPVAEPVPAPAAVTATGQAPVADMDLLSWVAAAMSVVKATRSHGHLLATLDPLGSIPPGDPALDPATVGLTPEHMAKIPTEVLRVNVPGDTFLAALPKLREAYCGTIAYEIEHITDHQQRLWWRRHIESGDLAQSLAPERKIAILERLAQVDAFERFLRRQYLGQKTFSIEGLDAMVPLTDEIIELVAESGTAEVVIGMAHRGRLSFITHVVGRPVESILAEFEGHMEFTDLDEEDADFMSTAGDVKYHLGAEGTFVTRAGRPVTVTLAANPSHLEQVNAVVEGSTRARQTSRQGNEFRHDPTVAVPVLIHGDAAFSGQGVVAETLNLQGLRGYTTGGTIHVIANNQIGFTTDPQDSRSTHGASDLARGFDVPIIHVNADDVEACLTAARLAVAFRAEYGRDVLIDLIGYRRLGHNEVDEPAYTQPVMSRTIKAHPPVSKIFGRRLIEEGLIDEGRLDEMLTAAEKRMTEAHRAVVSQEAAVHVEEQHGKPTTPRGETRPTRDLLLDLNEQLITVPDGFTIHPKLKPQLERRRQVMGDEGGIAWAHAEALAFASLLVLEGVPIRLTGQDSGRGTFSQRHLELHDMGEGETWTPRTGRIHVPMKNLRDAKATFELHNSPLSEAAAMGFEYGYSTRASEALVLWEAQYGDFANGAQIMIDQFIVSGRAKWGEKSRLTLLLPHGYEGNGPEHSSGRIERFLQLAAEDNIRVANCSTAAQYFHLLRKQALGEKQRPLIIFTPKSLLRQKSASSSLADLVDGRFQAVIADPVVADAAAVTELILCSGKVYHELQGHQSRGARTEVAIGRVEMLYPFPERDLRELFGTYPGLRRVRWVQEEPANMGAWDFVRPQLEAILPEGTTLAYSGRDRRASPSEGYPQAHQAEQERILSEALGGPSGGSATTDGSHGTGTSA